MTMPEFDPHAYALAKHGDSRERLWATRLAELWPHYDSFWRSHIVPLTFRPHQSDNYFVRPTQTRALLELADAAYATFFHFAGCLEWRDELPRGTKRARLRSSECLYCFFSHTGSLLDAALHFCKAVNKVLDRYDTTRAFSLRLDDHGRPVGLHRARSTEAAVEFQSLKNRLRVYRNFLVHTRPVLVQSQVIPKAECITELTGLTVISRVARNGESLRHHFEPINETLDGMLRDMGSALDRIWDRATEALDRIENPKYRRDQLRLRPDDAQLTLAKILAARGVR